MANVGPSSYTAGMARVAVLLLGLVGILLTAAGLIAALAWGLPALGLNPNGRNPFGETVQGLTVAATLYAVGAASLAIAIRWIRDHGGPQPVGALVPVGGLFVVLFVVISVWMAARGYWTNIPVLLFFMIGILAPMALGVLPRGTPLDRRIRS
jgi:hypothetical protein